MKSPKEVLVDWVAGWNARDAHALAALYHDDAANHQVALGEPLRGRAALLDSFITFFRAFPDNYTHPESFSNANAQLNSDPHHGGGKQTEDHRRIHRTGEHA